MTQDKTPEMLAVLFLGAMTIFLLPQLLNSAYASATTSYAKPLLIAFAIGTLGAIIYFLVGGFGKHG